MNEAASQIVDQMQAVAPAQVPTTQTPDPAAAKPEDKVSSKINILIQREQQALARERAAKAKETELEGTLARIKEFDSVKSNPKKALELLGLDYDQLTQSLLNDGTIPPEVHIKKLEEKFDAFKTEQQKADDQRLEDRKKEAEENEQKAITGFKGQINQYLSDNSARYELIAFESQQDLVFDVIDEHYNRTLKAKMEELAQVGEETSSAVGKVMSVSEAADKVELYLEQKYDKAKALKKVNSLWAAVPKETVMQAVKQETKTPQKPQTLTNNLSASAQTPRKGPLTDEERVQKAIAYAKSLRT